MPRPRRPAPVARAPSRDGTIRGPPAPPRLLCWGVRPRLYQRRGFPGAWRAQGLTLNWPGRPGVTSCRPLFVIGKKLGRYDILRVLNKGAMGMVYEGLDPVLQRQVAVKTILVEKLGEDASREYEKRFSKEALAGAKLLHPNIVPVFDFGHEDSVAYLVMQLVNGHDLKHHLDIGRRFPPPIAVGMVLDLLAALDHAHRNDVIHRDIKPANML